MLKKVKVTSTKNRIVDVLNTHKKFKNSYFWHGNNKNPNLNWKKEFYFKFNNNVYKIYQSCSSSAKNVYYQLQIYVNGEKKDIRALKSVI
jgi:hypothetical protein